MIHAIEDTLPINTAVMISHIPVAGPIAVLTSKPVATDSASLSVGLLKITKNTQSEKH